MNSKFYKDFVHVSNAYVSFINYNQRELVIANYGDGSICLSESQWTNDEAIAVAWSAGAIGMLVIEKDVVSFYSYLRSKPECVPLEKVGDSLPFFLTYLKDNYKPGEWLITRYIQDVYENDEEELSFEELIDKFSKQSYLVNKYCIKPIVPILHDVMDDEIRQLTMHMQFEKGQFMMSSYIGDMVSSLANIESLLAKKRLTIFDPSCGMGTLIVRFVDNLISRGYQGEILIRGWDNSEKMVTCCRRRLEGRYNGQCTIQINLKDSIADEWPRENDIVLLDPPVMEYEVLPMWEKYNVTSPSFLNISAVFMSKSVDSLAIDGELLAVLPLALMKRNQFSKWRMEVGKYIHPRIIASLGGGLFSRTHDKMALFVGLHANPKEVKFVWTFSEKVELSDVRSCLEQLQENRVCTISGICMGYRIPLNQLPIDSWTPISINELHIMQTLKIRYQQGKLVKLGTLFRFKYYKELPTINMSEIQSCLRSRANEQNKFVRCAIARDIFNGQLNTIDFVNKSHINKEQCLAVKNAVILSKKVGFEGPLIPLTKELEYVSGGYLWTPRESVKSKDLVCAYVAIFMSKTFMDLLSLQVPEKTTYGLLNLTSENLKEVLVPSIDEVGKFMQTLQKFGMSLRNGEVGVEVDNQTIRDLYGIQ